MDQNERLLISKAKAGDVAAFEQLIEAYQKKVYNLALRMTGNQEDAADLAQEAFIRVFRSISGFKEQSSFSTWVYRITTNVCLDEIRKRKNRKVISIDEDIHMDDGEMRRQIVSDDPLPDELAERAELRSIVNDAINSLPEDQRIVITLRDLNGLSYEEIAQILDIPGGTVKSRINRARQALRNVLSARTELLTDDYVK
ncbi:MAG TPA: sigma-70 family RNA polymerase sigma factor [Clostridiales bacterium]|nr:sigma-70 family RNA polymerase sigma factor [Clostridiales bacterium]HPV01010.1 sigma-70 family RNA polymerase sigma factor [Clostridiales bacterium]